MGDFKDGQKDTSVSNQDATMTWYTGESKAEFVGKFANNKCADGMLNGKPVSTEVVN